MSILFHETLECLVLWVVCLVLVVMPFPCHSLFQIIISIRSKDNHRPTAVEALRRAKFKFPGRQKILQSNKWGFTKYPREVCDPGLGKRRPRV